MCSELPSGQALWLPSLELAHWAPLNLPPSICPPQECGLLRKGTVLLADNVIFPGAPEFLAHVRASSHFECTSFTSSLEYSQVVDGLEKAVYVGPGRPSPSVGS